MTAVPLPNLTRIWQAQPRLVDFGIDATPPLGGVAQRITRLGSRWAVTFSDIPAFTQDAGRALLGAIFKARATGSTVSVAWPQPLYDASIGSPLINGASQGGTSLAIDGMPANARIKPGWFSVTASGRSYLYFATDETTANASGVIAALPIAPMLRASPADNAPLNFYAPVIEGFIQGNTDAWTLDMLVTIGIPSLTIQEVQ